MDWGISREQRWTWWYTLLGTFLGVLLPVIATLLDLALSETRLSGRSFLAAQSQQPLLWLIDFSPVILVLLGFAVGRRQDTAYRLNKELERRIQQVSHANKALASQMQERVELEERLRQSQKLEAVGRLAGGVAHDFNNLLTAIIGYADLLLAELKTGDPRRDYADEIHRAGDRAAALVQQLLGFSRRQMIVPRVIDVNAELSDSHRLLERVIGENIRLDVIKSDRPTHVLVDPVQLDQVLVNLVVNARDAMPDGGTVTVRAARVSLAERDCDFCNDARPGDYCLLEVSDNGVGIDEATLEKIFEPFFTTKDKSKGTGLGLATTYGIVKQNGGFIHVLSHMGAGATFRVYLPLREGEVSVIESHAGRSSRGGQECILLVEDEDIVRTLASKTLRDRGYEVLEAAHADAATEIWTDRKNDVDLLVTDIIMPGRDGKQLSETLCVEKPDMRVLFMSGYDNELLREHDINDDTPDFIPKPFTVDAFAGKVRELLDA